MPGSTCSEWIYQTENGKLKVFVAKNWRNSTIFQAKKYDVCYDKQGLTILPSDQHKDYCRNISTCLVQQAFAIVKNNPTILNFNDYLQNMFPGTEISTISSKETSKQDVFIVKF